MADKSEPPDPKVVAALREVVEEIQERRHREGLAQMFPPRPACERHGWYPERGPGLVDASALASLCPACRAERRLTEREAEIPETVTLDRYTTSPLAAKLWDKQLDMRAQMGELLPGSAAEREALHVVDEARRDEIYELKLTPAHRRRIHREHWGRKLRVHRQTYTPHPARAGR
jgi:hypothetical protein